MLAVAHVGWGLFAVAYFGRDPAWLGFEAAAGIAFAAAFALASRGRWRTALLVVVLATFVATTIGVFAQRRDAAVLAYVALLATGAVILQPRAALGALLGGSAVIAAFWALELNGLIAVPVPGSSFRARAALLAQIVLFVPLVGITIGRLDRDRQRLRASEARFRALAEQAPDLIAEVDARGRFLYANPSHEAQLGYPADSLVGRDSWELVHPDDRGEAARLNERLRSEGRGMAEWRVVRADGSVARYQYSVAVFASQEGPWRVVGVGRDVTRQRELEEQLQRARRLDAMGRLASGVAHDVNNFITVVIGNAAAIAEEAGDPDAVGERAAEILGAAERCAELLRRLTAFGRGQSLEPRLIDLNRVVGEMQGLLRRTLPPTIRIEARLEASPASVVVDPVQIEQVVLNLALNARDAMPGGGRLTIETRAADVGPEGRERGPQVVLAVSDTGIGMDAETLRHIFEPFFTTKGPESGTGLGLAVVHGIVRQSGGTIEVKSEPGKGTEVEVFLPAAEPELGASALGS